MVTQDMAKKQSTMSRKRSSSISGFYKMTLDERLEELRGRGVLDAEDIALLSSHHGGLSLEIADQMIENVIGVMELPLGVGLNFQINQKDYFVPMSVEEPSIVAAVSHVAKITRASGGFRATCDANVMIGQIQVVGVPDIDAATAAILEAKPRLLANANALHPNMQRRGGGAKDLEVRVLGEGSAYQTMLVVHLLIDCCDAMGANLVNTMAEGIAPDIEALTGGRVFLRILSNLADQRVVRASCSIPFEALGWKGYSGEQVAKGIELASQFAELDPYRAATHNKGIMNGIGAVCIATGNDWRAIEAGAHAYCCRDGKYGPMATWHVEEGHLVGRLEIPIQVGTVGGPIKLHPTVKLAHKILGTQGAKELAQVMGAVGLAQNLGALKALATVGIQKGHMSLHARSVAATAGAREHELDLVVSQLIAEDEVKVQRAGEILRAMRAMVVMPACGE